MLVRSGSAASIVQNWSLSPTPLSFSVQRRLSQAISKPVALHQLSEKKLSWTAMEAFPSGTTEQDGSSLGSPALI
jgi:hypothetical protein